MMESRSWPSGTGDYRWWKQIRLTWINPNTFTEPNSPPETFGADRVQKVRKMCHTLIIEDDWLVAQLISDIATESGATSVDIAATEREAVMAALDRSPAMIISDVQLSEGTGPAAVKEIRDRLGEIPVIFITGTLEACDPCNFASAIVAKPFSDQLVAHLFRQVAPV